MLSSVFDLTRIIQPGGRLLVFGYSPYTAAFAANYHSTIVIDENVPLFKGKSNIIRLPMEKPQPQEATGGPQRGLKRVAAPGGVNHAWYDRKLFLRAVQGLGTAQWDVVIIDGPPIDISNRAVILHDDILRAIGNPHVWIVPDTHIPVIRSVSDFIAKRFHGKTTRLESASYCVDMITAK